MKIFSKNHCKSGIDGINFEYKISMDGINNLNFVKQKLNDKQKIIVKIKGHGGIIRGSIIPIHGICENNETSLGIGIINSIKLELVRNEILEFIKECLEEQLQHRYSDGLVNKLKITHLEVNINLPCVGKATADSMSHLFDMVFDETTVYRTRKMNTTKCEKESTGVKYKKPHYYFLKIYDKSRELNRENVSSPLKNLFRIEIVFLDRSLNSMFGKNGRTLENILSGKSVEILCKEYKIILEEIIVQHVKPYLVSSVNLLAESLIENDSGKGLADTICRHKEIIVDIECLRRALQRWYKYRGVKDHSKQNIYKCRQKGLRLPEDVLKTLKEFHNAAG